ncbi:MAG: hypothetical protein ACRC2V_18640, partial [Xenococcaceae cyanobacterium]
PFLSQGGFAGMCANADVFLDAIGWSGCNTVLESLSCNLPIVTLPGKLMRGRHALAILEMMGVTETIAANKDEYVQIAIRLGSDLGYRQYLARRLDLNKYKLYYDRELIYAIENFLGNLFGQEFSKSKQRRPFSKLDLDSIKVSFEFGTATTRRF